MMATFINHLRPSHFTRGRLAAWLCCLYLALVLVGYGYVINDRFFEDPGDPLSGLLLLLVTAPMSFIAVPVLDAMGALDIYSTFGTVLLDVISLCLGLVQAYIAWLVLRGRRVVGRAAREGRRRRRRKANAADHCYIRNQKVRNSSCLPLEHREE